MTIAVCFMCGSFKFGSLCSCDSCLAVPKSENEVARSLVMSDHYFNQATLKEIGERIASGRVIEFEPSTLTMITENINKQILL